MSDKDGKNFPYALLRAEFLAFLALLALAIGASAWYPRLCLAWGREAMRRGQEERAIRLLASSDLEEARELLLTVRTERAERLIAEGAFEEAQELLADLSVVDPADERVAACIYGRAMAQVEREEPEQALELFSTILGYRDAAEQRRRCEKELARKAFLAGDRETALFYVRLNPQDEQMRAIATAVRRQDALDLLSSDPEAGLAVLRQMWLEGADVEADLLAALRRCYPNLFLDKDDDFLRQQLRQMDEAALAERSRRLERVSSLPRGVVALGNEHSVLLKRDGTVLCCGDNSFGQCAVENWTDVTAVAAGAYHTLGLRSDGTVLCTGDDRYGQCRVGEIRDAVEIAAHGFDTVVRCQDGSIRSFGAHDYNALAADWKRIGSLALGGYALIGLSEEGAALSTEPTFLTEAFRSLIVIDAAGTYAAGVTDAGRVVTSSLWQPEWEGVLDVSAASGGIMGLLEDGTVRFFLREDRDYGPILSRTDVVAIAFSGRHAAALLQDGTLLLCGDDSAGQCSLSGTSR